VNECVPHDEEIFVERSDVIVRADGSDETLSAQRLRFVFKLWWRSFIYLAEIVHTAKKGGDRIDVIKRRWPGVRTRADLPFMIEAL
jgi:hypothetical protein